MTEPKSWGGCCISGIAGSADDYAIINSIEIDLIIVNVGNVPRRLFSHYREKYNNREK